MHALLSPSTRFKSTEYTRNVLIWVSSSYELHRKHSVTMGTWRRFQHTQSPRMTEMFRFQKYQTKGIYYKLLNICKGVRKIGAILSTQRSISLRGMESRAKLSSTIYSSIVYSIGNHLSFEPSSTSTGGGVEVVFHRSADEWRFWCNC